MKLCMFSPRELDLERGWPGRIDGDTVIQLAAQTLQAFFTGGGTAREHAEYPLADVVFRAPVLHPPSVRIFDDAGDFRVRESGRDLKAAAEDPGRAGRRPGGARRGDHRRRRRDRRLHAARRVDRARAARARSRATSRSRSARS